MDETKTRSKRHIPIAVIVALALALAVGAAFAGYYIYTTYAVSQQEEPTDTASESEEPPEEQLEEQSEANPAYDEAMAAYTDVLDEYRTFMEFVNAGGNIDSLERDQETYALIDYPHVNDAFTWNSSEGDTDCNQFAYADLDGNGIPELVVGDGSNQPIEVYTYSNGEVISLFGYMGGCTRLVVYRH